MTDDRSHAAGDWNPDTYLLGADRNCRQERGRQPSRGDPALADVDDQDPQRKDLALRAQRIGAAGIATAESADIHPATHASHYQAPDDRAHEVAQQDLDEELSHAARRAAVTPPQACNARYRLRVFLSWGSALRACNRCWRTTSRRSPVAAHGAHSLT